MRFEFATATRILFGPGAIAEVASSVRALGQSILIVTGSKPDRVQSLLPSLEQYGLTHEIWSIPGEPTVEMAAAGAAKARAMGSQVVLAVGGGSVMDAGKAIAAFSTNPGDPFTFLEVIGQGQPLPRPPLPIVAVPTTAGTGSEVTRNAVLQSPAHQVKVSLRSPLLLPHLAVVDPELTLKLPRSLTASTGMDALTQLIEPLVSLRANPLTDAICREGLASLARSLRIVCERPDDLNARQDMALASLCSGLALANAGLGAVHGFAAPIGGMFSAAHGAVCAALLPHAMDMNLAALRQRASDSRSLARYQEIAAILTGRSTATAADGVQWVRELATELNIPSLSQHGIRPHHIQDICAKASTSSSMKGNPILLTDVELVQILTAAL